MIYRGENFSIDTVAFALWRDGEQKPIEPQVFDLLVYLIENRDRVVTRDELLENLWPGRVVSENALNGRLKIARKAVGDDGRQQRVIRTLHRRGYRFVADVTVAEPTGQPVEIQADPPATMEGKPSIALLTLEYQGDDGSRQYIANALTEEITTNLSRYRELFVIAHPSTSIYSAANADGEPPDSALSVDYLARGQVRLSGDQIRVSVKLIETSEGKTIWGERFDRPVDDLFALEDEVAARIAVSLAKRIGDESIRRAARKAPENLTAYDCVMRALSGVMSFDEEVNRRARALLEQAVALDPDYAAAHALLSHSYCADGESGWGLPLDEAIARAEPHARRAVELDDFESDAHRGLGWVLLHQRKYDLAELHFDRAIECNPNDYDTFCMKGWLLVGNRRIDDAASCISAAMRLNPLAPDMCLQALMFAAYLDGRYREALDIYPKIHEPDSGFESLRAACLAKLGRHGEAREAAARALELDEELIRKPDWIDKWPLADARDIEHFLSGLYAAGVLVDPSQKSRKPSIVVLKFTNLSTQDGQEYFADGISMNVRSCLSRIHALHIVSALDIDSSGKSGLQVAQACGADYLLSGSVQREGDRVRVFVELTDGQSGAIKWSERFDRSGEQVIEIQDDIATSIVATLWGGQGKIREAVRDNLATKQTRDFNAFDCILNGIFCKEQFTAETLAQAGVWFDKAIELDPNCAEAYAWKAINMQCEIYIGCSDDVEALDKALAAARRAIEIDPSCENGYLALGWAYNSLGEHDRGLAAFEKAMQINPNDTDLMVFAGEELATTHGRIDDGIELIRRGIRFNLNPPDWYFWHLGLANFSALRLIDAIDAFERMGRQNKDTLIHLAACHAHTGRLDRAAERFADLMREDPQFSPEQTAETHKHYSDEVYALMLRGLEIANGSRAPDTGPKIVQA